VELHGDLAGYASEVLQKRSGINRVKQLWAMMFLRSPKSSLAGEWKERHDPEEEYRKRAGLERDLPEQ
jgi:hypothetical protein